MDTNLLKELLEKRLEIIGDEEMRTHQPETQLQQLAEVSQKIDQWRDQHSADLPFQLRHFLENYSLNKALDYITEGKRKCQ